jgi:hypothetical protein
MPDVDAVLYINKSESRCGACGLGCDPTELTHETLLGYAAINDAMEGCHARFVATDSDYVGMPGLPEAIEKMRPDLPYIGWKSNERGDRWRPLR